ncbi:MAG: DUF4249 family protein [Flavobacteriaceae bacterium]
MRTYIKTMLLLVGIVVSSCEDVIDVPVQSGQIRLTVEASIDWEKGTTGNNQTITLRNSTEFFDTSSNTAVTGATVKITNDTDGTEFTFVDQHNGDYTTTEFVPAIGQSYTLEIGYQGAVYTAQESMKSVTDVNDVYQAIEDGFNNEELEAHIVFHDPVDEHNYYLFKFRKQGDLLPAFEVADDQFVNGNELDWWYEINEDEDTEKIEAFRPGDVLAVEMYGISSAYYHYMSILIEQIGGVGLFQATPVSVKGNVVNQTNADDYANGYFRLSQVNKLSYTFE